ncbi:MAG: helix-turn-helix domain-containing protein [Actinobacteria bacterium]|nr:helix-turn-helix domain-containing protein [Actinomycetota bacterium]
MSSINLENIKKLRNKKGWSQERLAKESDVSYQTLIKIEQNKVKNPKLQTLIKLAKALEVTLDELVNSSI